MYWAMDYKAKEHCLQTYYNKAILTYHIDTTIWAFKIQNVRIDTQFKQFVCCAIHGARGEYWLENKMFSETSFQLIAGNEILHEQYIKVGYKIGFRGIWHWR